MSVHKALTAHVNGLSHIIQEYSALDESREVYIEEACTLCKEGKLFTTNKINEITKRMNLLSKKIENLPERKYVTVEMVEEYVKKSL